MRKWWIFVLPLFLFSSCEMLLRVKDQFLPSMGTNDSHSISVSSLSHNQNISNEIESVQVPTIILMEGNHLVHGLPCFGENAFQAIKGEYKIEMPEDSAIQSPDDSALLITSWLTSEFMYLSPDLWEVRNSLRNLRAMEMQDDQGLYIVSRFPDTIANQEKWTIVFSIPQKTLEAGINNTMINSIIQNWTSRLSYYVSISQNDVQISLPAVVEF